MPRSGMTQAPEPASHARPKQLGSFGHVIPKSLGSGAMPYPKTSDLTTMPRLLGLELVLLFLN